MNGNTWQRPRWFYKNATSGEATAGEMIFNLASGSAKPTDDVFLVSSVKRGGIEQAGYKVSYSTTTGYITVENAGSFTLTAEDLVVCGAVFVKE